MRRLATQHKPQPCAQPYFSARQPRELFEYRRQGNTSRRTVKANAAQSPKSFTQKQLRNRHNKHASVNREPSTIAPCWVATTTTLGFHSSDQNASHRAASGPCRIAWRCPLTVSALANQSSPANPFNDCEQSHGRLNGRFLKTPPFCILQTVQYSSSSTVGHRNIAGAIDRTVLLLYYY